MTVAHVWGLLCCVFKSKGSLQVPTTLNLFVPKKSTVS